MIMFFSNIANSQIDLGVDASFAGAFAGAKITYPIADKVIVGGSYSYNLTNPYILSRFGPVIGIKFHEWLQIEADIGWIHGYYNETAFMNKKLSTIAHIDFGIKSHFTNNMYLELKIAFPGFMRIGIGFRLRPYKKLTVWDLQD